MSVGYAQTRIAVSPYELREFSPAEFPEALDAASQLVAATVAAGDVQICFALRDAPLDGPLHGWRIAGGHRFGPNAARDERILDEWYRSARNKAVDPSVRALIRTRGEPRAFLRRDVADELTWRRSTIDDLLAESRVRDRLVAGAPLGADAELLLVTYRRTGQRIFGDDERDRLARLAAELRPVGRTVARAQGLIDSRAPLTRREQHVLQSLLRGCTEPQAAAHLGLTTRSLHQHVVAIHRKLGVRSRGELVSHFLEPVRREAAVARLADHLAAREAEVLRCLARGLSEKEVADRMQMSTRATHHVVGSIYRKLGVANRAALLGRVMSMSAARVIETRAEVVAQHRLR